MSFKIIGITLPYFFDGEAEAITAFLESGRIARMHLRKPESEGDPVQAENMRRLIEKIPSRLHHRLSLHDHHTEAIKYGCGIHLNKRNPVAPSNYNGIISWSCHSIEEIILHNKEDYLFLSPIYPSISKPGYVPTLCLSSLKGIVNSRIIALGGVTPRHFPELEDVGFGGAAMLGALWENI